MEVSLQRQVGRGRAVPVVTVLPPSDRAGRYRVQLSAAQPASALPSSSCRCQGTNSRALVWLAFFEAGRETDCQLSDIICSRCEPERYTRAVAWAQALN